MVSEEDRVASQHQKMLAATIYLSMCVTDFFLIDLLLIIQQRCYDIACSPALVGTLMPCLDSVMDKVATEILSRWVSFVFKKICMI